MPVLSNFYHNELSSAYLRSIQNFCSILVLRSSWRNTKYVQIIAVRECFSNTVRK